MGLSRATFAEALGVKPDKVKHIETGFQRADHEFLAALHVKFGVDLNEIVGGKIGAQPHTDAADIGAIISLADALFARIPRHTVEASAGHGALVDDEDASEFLAIHKDWLAKRGLSPDHLAIISVKGDSMAPALIDGELIMLDRSQATLRHGAIFVVSYSDGLFVKRIQQLPGDRLQLISANPEYPPIIVDQCEVGTVKVVGRVVASMREW